jgi:hypothetical protein
MYLSIHEYARASCTRRARPASAPPRCGTDATSPTSAATLRGRRRCRSPSGARRAAPARPRARQPGRGVPSRARPPRRRHDGLSRPLPRPLGSALSCNGPYATGAVARRAGCSRYQDLA